MFHRLLPSYLKWRRSKTGTQIVRALWCFWPNNSSCVRHGYDHIWQGREVTTISKSYLLFRAATTTHTRTPLSTDFILQTPEVCGCCCILVWCVDTGFIFNPYLFSVSNPFAATENLLFNNNNNKIDSVLNYSTTKSRRKALYIKKTQLVSKAKSSLWAQACIRFIALLNLWL